MIGPLPSPPSPAMQRISAILGRPIGSSLAHFNATLRQLQVAIGSWSVCDRCFTDFSPCLLLLFPVPQANCRVFLRRWFPIHVFAVQYCICAVMQRLRWQNHRRQRHHCERSLVPPPALRMLLLRREFAVRLGVLFQRCACIRIIRNQTSRNVWFLSCGFIRPHLLQLLKAARWPARCCRRQAVSQPMLDLLRL